MIAPKRRTAQEVYSIEEDFRKFCERDMGFIPCQRIKVGDQWSDYVLPLSDEEYADLANTKGQKVVVYVDMPRAQEVWDAIGIRYYERNKFIGVSFATDYHLLREYSNLGKKHTLWIAPTPAIMGPNGIVKWGSKFEREVALLERKGFDEVIYALKNHIPLYL
jgi:hypothetical protein